MSDKEIKTEEGQEVVRKAVVVGRPSARRAQKTLIPIGIEKVLCRAAADAEFRQILFENRHAAIQAFGQNLSDTERDVLTGIPNPMLQGMVGRIDLRKHTRSRLLRGVLAAAMLMSTTMVESCSSSGIQPYEDVQELDALVEVGESMDSRGIQPDAVSEDLVEPDAIAVEDTMTTKGVLPEPDAR